MRKIFFSLILLFLLFWIGSCSNNNDPVIPPVATELSYEALLEELNFARTKPEEYAKIIEATLQYYNGNLLEYPGEVPIYTLEGKAAVEEAIAALKSQQPRNALFLNAGLNKAAQYHCDKQGITGETGHDSPDGKNLMDRILMYGTFASSYSYGENITYGPVTPRKVIIGLIVDDGVSDRGHRINIYDPAWTDVGFGWGYHKKYDIMCVMDFARGYIANNM